MISNIFSMPRPLASDEVARAMAQEAMALATQSSGEVAAVAWFDATGLTTGVATTDGESPMWDGGSVQTGSDITDIAVADLTATDALYSYTLLGGVDDLAGVPPASQASGPHLGAGGIGYRLYAYYDARTAVVNATSPNLAIGDKVYLRFPRIKGIDGAAADGFGVTFVESVGSGTRANIAFDGSRIWTAGDTLSNGTFAQNVEVTDNGDGTSEITIEVFAATAPVTAARMVGFSTSSVANQTTTGIEFESVQVIVGTTSPHGNSVGAGAGLVVADPAVGSHQATLPFVLSLRAAKPSGSGTVCEIIGTTGGEAGDLIARLNVALNTPQLVVSENGGISALTATLPASSWSNGTAADIALRVDDEEVVLFIDGRAVTGLPLTAVPTAIDSYSVASRGDGASAVGMVLEAVSDGNGTDVISDLMRIMDEDELDALPMELCARLYGEIA